MSKLKIFFSRMRARMWCQTGDGDTAFAIPNDSRRWSGQDCTVSHRPEVKGRERRDLGTSQQNSGTRPSWHRSRTRSALDRLSSHLIPSDFNLFTAAFCTLPTAFVGIVCLVLCWRSVETRGATLISFSTNPRFVLLVKPAAYWLCQAYYWATSGMFATNPTNCSAIDIICSLGFLNGGWEGWHFASIFSASPKTVVVVTNCIFIHAVTDTWYSRQWLLLYINKTTCTVVKQYSVCLPICAESSLPVAHPGYQFLSDILFRLGLIANALTQCSA